MIPLWPLFFIEFFSVLVILWSFYDQSCVLTVIIEHNCDRGIGFFVAFYNWVHVLMVHWFSLKILCWSVVHNCELNKPEDGEPDKYDQPPEHPFDKSAGPWKLSYATDVNLCLWATDWKWNYGVLFLILIFIGIYV